MTKTYYVLWKWYEGRRTKWREYISGVKVDDCDTEYNISEALMFDTLEQAKVVKSLVEKIEREEYNILKVEESEVDA